MTILKEVNKPVGKLGNVVYYFWKNEYRSRAYIKPIQPGTPAQLARWNKFASGVTTWQSFTGIVKNVYNTRAKPLKMSGFNLFMREHMNS